MCQYCEIGISMVKTNMVSVAIDHTIYGENNACVKCFDTRGKEMVVPFKINNCPMCGRKLK